MTTYTTVKRLVKSNFSKIEADARVAFGDGVLFELIQYVNPTEEAVIVIRGGKLDGVYAITKTRAPRWLGDNGYIFTRTRDGLTLNATSKPADQDREDALASVEAAPAVPAASIWQGATVYTQDHGIAAKSDRYEVGAIATNGRVYFYHYAMDIIGRDTLVQQLINAGATLAAPVASADEVEFNRLFVAGRGTLRIERGDYVIIAHCHTIEYITTTLIRDTRWYVSVNFEGDPIKRDEFAASLTYQALDAYVTSVVSKHAASI